LFIFELEACTGQMDEWAGTILWPTMRLQNNIIAQR